MPTQPRAHVSQSGPAKPVVHTHAPPSPVQAPCTQAQPASIASTVLPSSRGGPTSTLTSGVALSSTLASAFPPASELSASTDASEVPASVPGPPSRLTSGFDASPSVDPASGGP